MVRLGWNDPWGASANNYDLYLFDQYVNQVAVGSTVQDGQGGNDFPFEQIDFTATYTGYYQVAARSVNNPAVRNLNLYVSTGLADELTYQTAAGSIAIPADSPNAMTIGAVAWNTPTVIKPYSSQGPTTDGRIKPDLVAPTDVATVSWPGFSGTSAATPHASGAAVLVKQRYSYTPAQIQSYLENNAVDLGAAGKDNVYGSGRLQLPPPSVSYETLRPMGDGSEKSIDYPAPPTSHWDKVSDVNPDDDASYVENKNGAVGSMQRDLYAIGNHSLGSGNINKVTITTRTLFNAPSPCLYISLKTHGVVYDYDYSAYTQSVWTNLSKEMPVNPYTAAARTWAEIDDLEAGLSLGGSTYIPDWSRVTQVYVVVEYLPSSPSYTETLVPTSNAAGEITFPSQSPSSGAHWDKLDETPTDERGTTIDIEGSPGDPYYRDLFEIQNHSAGSGTINSVTVYARVWQIYLQRYAYIAIKTGGVVYESPPISIPSGQSNNYPFMTVSHQWTTKPGGGVWQWSDIDALQAGIRQNAWYWAPNNWGTARTTQVYVEVLYTP